MEYLQIKGWKLMQQYKDRDPKWIKLDRELLDNYAFCMLDDTAKYHVIGLRLLAAKLGNKIPNDPTWIRDKISSITEVNIQPLIDAGFIEFYDGTESCVQICTELYVEKSRTEKSKEKDSNNYQEIKGYWNSKENLTSIRALSTKRKCQLKVRLLEEGFKWRDIIDKIAMTPFCCGSNDRNWKADFDWFIANDNNYVKVLEGKYGEAKCPQKTVDENNITQWSKNKGWIEASNLAQLKAHPAFMANMANDKFRLWATEVNPIVKGIVL